MQAAEVLDGSEAELLGDPLVDNLTIALHWSTIAAEIPPRVDGATEILRERARQLVRLYEFGEAERLEAESFISTNQERQRFLVAAIGLPEDEEEEVDYTASLSGHGEPGDAGGHRHAHEPRAAKHGGKEEL